MVEWPEIGNSKRWVERSKVVGARRSIVPENKQLVTFPLRTASMRNANWGGHFECGEMNLTVHLE